MGLPDVSVLVYAHRADTAHPAGCRDWLEKVIKDLELQDWSLRGARR